MSVQVPLLTADELDQFPDDGKRREIIAGELYVSPAPAKPHQQLSGHLHVLLYNALVPTKLGEVYFAPVDVRFSERDQVQPDLLVILSERLSIYRGHIVFGAPDIVIEILSPSNRSVDLVEKARLYAENGVPEYWILDPIEHTFQMFRLEHGRHVHVAPEGNLHRSAVIPGLVIDQAALFSRLESD
jgi:Uma2 family endonuclease